MSPLERLRDRLRRDDRGVTAVEFAIILPLLLMLVFGIVEFGRAYQARLTVTHAAREGVRVLAVTEDQTAAENAARAAATGLKATDSKGRSKAHSHADRRVCTCGSQEERAFAT